MSEYKIAGYPMNLDAQIVTIAAGASASEMIVTQGRALVAIQMPAAWTAASLGFKVCLTGNPADLLPVYNNGGTVVTTPAAANTYIAFPLPDAVFGPYLQITSVTAGTTTGVNQVAAATLILLFKNFLG